MNRKTGLDCGSQNANMRCADSRSGAYRRGNQATQRLEGIAELLVSDYNGSYMEELPRCAPNILERELGEQARCVQHCAQQGAVDIADSFQEGNGHDSSDSLAQRNMTRLKP
jgi:hypothetical protein